MARQCGTLPCSTATAQSLTFTYKDVVSKFSSGMASFKPNGRPEELSGYRQLCPLRLRGGAGLPEAGACVAASAAHCSLYHLIEAEGEAAGERPLAE